MAYIPRMPILTCLFYIHYILVIRPVGDGGTGKTTFVKVSRQPHSLTQVAVLTYPLSQRHLTGEFEKKYIGTSPSSHRLGPSPS
jgi:hypothetical protein